MLLRSTGGCASLAAGLVSLGLLGGPPGCTEELTGTDSSTSGTTETGSRDSGDTAPTDSDTDTAPTGPVDADGDGYDNRYDCDDTDPEVHPNADDRTQDGVDQDCDGLDGDDRDLDGYKTELVGGPDCDDEDPAVNPAAEDVPWDDFDQDCSGSDLHTFTSIDAYDTFLCGVATTGQAWCWNGAGWKLEAPTASYSAVSAGRAHACGITTDGETLCWGSDYDGEIADVPTAGLASISAGSKLTCGILDDLSVACWGNDEYDQLDVPAGEFSLVDAEHYSAGALGIDGIIHYWGGSGLGDPKVWPVPPPTGTYRGLGIHSGAYCAVSTGGELVCWAGASAIVDHIPAGSNYTQLHVGRYHACALDDLGHVTCWGEDYYSTGTISDTPTTPGWVQVVTTTSDSCALDTDGVVTCWGCCEAPPGSL